LACIASQVDDDRIEKYKVKIFFNLILNKDVSGDEE